MRQAIATKACCLLLILTNHCAAWSEAGHIAIAELAQRNLPEQTQNTLREYANILLAGAPKSRAAWRNRYPNYSAVSYAAAWPDTIRGRSVEELFQHYGTTVPPELNAYRGKTTNNWHYTNRWFYSEQGVGIPAYCREISYRFNNNGELLPVIERLYAGFKRSNSEAQRAVMLALLIHLLSDLHQPLHNFAGVNSDCHHDRGGSGFCVVRQSREVCELNLHQWWDRGIGLFDHPVNLTRVTTWLDDSKLNGASAALSAEPGAVRLTARLKVWSDESRQYTASVYALQEGRVPGSNYVDDAQEIVKKQTVIAVQRLRTVLLTLID